MNNEKVRLECSPKLLREKVNCVHPGISHVINQLILHMTMNFKNKHSPHIASLQQCMFNNSNHGL